MIHITYRFNITITNEKKSKKTTRRRRFAGAWHAPARLLPASCTRLLGPCAAARLAWLAVLPAPGRACCPAVGVRAPARAVRLAVGRSAAAARGPHQRLARARARPVLVAPWPAPGRELREGGGGNEGEGGVGRAGGRR